MGLFGGFKAKFTRNSKNKDNIQEVVCTKYHVYSEFDAPYSVNGVASPSRAVPNPQPRQHQIKPKRPLVKSELYDTDVNIQPPFKKTQSLQNLSVTSKPLPIPENSPPPLPRSRPPTIILDDYEESTDHIPSKQLTLFEKSTPPIPKARQNGIVLNDYDYEYPDENSISISTHFEVPSNSKSVAFSETSIDRNLRKHENGETEETFEIITKNSLYSSGNDYDSLFQKKSKLTTNNHYEDMSLGDDASTLILMTQHSLVNEEPEKYLDKNHSDYSYAYTSSYEDDEFKVNVVKHDKKTISFSEDEISNPDLADDDDDDNNNNDYRDLGYSSQASSIFFGGDLNPLASRTKMIALKDNQESDEEDC